MQRQAMRPHKLHEIMTIFYIPPNIPIISFSFLNTLKCFVRHKHNFGLILGNLNINSSTQLNLDKNDDK